MADPEDLTLTLMNLNRRFELALEAEDTITARKLAEDILRLVLRSKGFESDDYTRWLEVIGHKAARPGFASLSIEMLAKAIERRGIRYKRFLGVEEDQHITERLSEKTFRIEPFPDAKREAEQIIKNLEHLIRFYNLEIQAGSLKKGLLELARWKQRYLMHLRGDAERYRERLELEEQFSEQKNKKDVQKLKQTEEKMAALGEEIHQIRVQAQKLERATNISPTAFIDQALQRREGMEQTKAEPKRERLIPDDFFDNLNHAMIETEEEVSRKNIRNQTPDFIQDLMNDFYKAQTVQEAEILFQGISDKINTLTVEERKGILKEQAVLLKTPFGKLLIQKILSTSLKGGAVFGFGLFVKHVLEDVFGSDSLEESYASVLCAMPTSLVDYFIFAAGGFLSEAGWGTAIQMPFEIWKAAILKQLIRDLGKYGGLTHLCNTLRKSGLSKVQLYERIAPFLKSQVSFWVGLALVQYWHTGKIDTQKLFTSGICFLVPSAVIHFGKTRIIIKIAQVGLEIPKFTGLAGVVAASIELGVTLFFAGELEAFYTHLNNQMALLEGLKEKSSRFHALINDASIGVSEIEAYFNHDFHPAFVQFKGHQLRELFMAQERYVESIEIFEKENNPLYQAMLEKESWESIYEDALKTAQRGPRDTFGSALFPMLSETFRHRPDIRSSDSAILARGKILILDAKMNELSRQIDDTSGWKQEYDQKTEEFNKEMKSKLEHIAQKVRTESYHPLFGPLAAKYQRFVNSGSPKDYEAYLELSKVAGLRALEADLAWVATTPLPEAGTGKDSAVEVMLQEIAFVDRMVSELKPDLSATARAKSAFLQKKSVDLRLELLALESFLANPFDVSIPEEEERKMPDILFEQLALAH